MKKTVIILLSILLFSIQLQAADPYEDAQRNRQQDTTINGEWDTRGTHYTPAGGGNKWRQDGTFMQKVAGGYIDTKTGQFIPSNE